jgi:phosphopantothenoylcysteine decarboxylase/phosphopantothenate--cysteine ligase
VRPYAGRRVLLGVTGGIASYKATWLARLLHKAGAEVDVVLTRSAREFVGGITFEALTGRPVHEALIAEGRALEHIHLAKAADVVVVVPATADFLSRAAAGRADDLLTAILLATEAPVVLAPAMNDMMWAHAAVGANVARCRELGYTIIEPATGDLAAGEGTGAGRLPEPEEIFAHIGRALATQSLAGTQVLVTAGPTREAIDPVRYISNHSSGRMGVAIAAAAWRRGAAVTLVHGPLEVPVPVGITAIPVESTAEMHETVGAAIGRADVVVMAAAPADFTVSSASAHKLKRADLPPSLELDATADILDATRAQRRADATIVGFALETTDGVANAQRKRTAKGLDLIVLNYAGEANAGFGASTNRVTLIDEHSVVELPLQSKHAVADALLDRVEALRSGR